jgi:hypothetical protein
MGGTAARRSIPVDELVGLLDRWDPKSLHNLQERYSEYAALLRPGVLAGETSNDLEVRIEVCASGLSAAVDACRECLTRRADRLKRSYSMQVLGQTLTLLAGASIFAVLAIDAPKFAKYSAAIIALAGSVLT